MPRSHINLSIDTDIYRVAKDLKINLSSEFEQWIKIRMDSQIDKIDNANIDIEIAKHQEAIESLKKSLEIRSSKEQQEKDENESLEKVIKNMIDSHDDKGIDWNTHIQMSASGVQLLYKRRFNKYITFKEAVELLQKKLKEHDING